jgi:hypothetical protein
VISYHSCVPVPSLCRRTSTAKREIEDVIARTLSRLQLRSGRSWGRSATGLDSMGAFNDVEVTETTVSYAWLPNIGGINEDWRSVAVFVVDISGVRVIARGGRGI